MRFQYKLKYYKDEDGEYTNESICDKQLIEKIILDHWTGEQLPNGLELIIIVHADGPSIILEHSAKEVFEVYFLKPDQKFLFHKKSRIELIYDVLSAFMDNDFSWLENNLNKTRNENRLIRKLIVSKDFLYELRSARIWSQINQTLLFGIPIGLTFSVASIVTMAKLQGGSVIDILLLFVFSTGLALWLPGLIIHYQYKRDNENLTIRLTKGEDIIRVGFRGVKKDLHKGDISTVTVIRNPSYKLPWSDYGYTQVKFKNGDVVNLTNLIIDQFLITDKFAKCDVLMADRIYPAITQRTSIK
jgi:phosphopantetheine adenylyltransferase